MSSVKKKAAKKNAGKRSLVISADERRLLYSKEPLFPEKVARAKETLRNLKFDDAGFFS